MIRKHPYLILTIMCLMLVSFSSSAKERVGLVKVPISQLLRVPPANMMETNITQIELRFMPDGDFIAGLQLGIFNRLTLGLSYGANNLLSYNELQWNRNIGFLIKYLICTEGRWNPALSVGIDTQGWGYEHNNPASGERRFLFKAPGLYAAFGKNFYPLCIGAIGVHTVLNYNFIEAEDDRDVNLMFGMNKSIWKWFSFVTEYDLALNDNSFQAYSSGSGYINFALRYRPVEQLIIELSIIDVTGDNSMANSETTVIRFIFRSL